MSTTTYTIPLSISCYRSTTRSTNINYTTAYTSGNIVGVASGGSYYYGCRFYPAAGSQAETDYKTCRALYNADPSNIASIKLQFTKTATTSDVSVYVGVASNSTSSKITAVPTDTETLTAAAGTKTISVKSYGFGQYGYCAGGYRNVYVSCSVSNAYLVVVVNNVEHTLTTSVSPSGAGSVTSGDSMAEGATKSVVATAASGYTFSNWTVSGTGSSVTSLTDRSTTFTMGTADATLTANFTAEVTVSVSTVASPSTYGSVTPSSVTIASGSTYQFTATPASASTQYFYTFDHWELSGDGSISSLYDNPVTYTAAGNGATLTAVFTRSTESHTVTTNISPTGAGVVYGGGVIARSASCQMTAVPASGYEFSSWSVSGSGSFVSSTTTNPTTFTMGTENATVTAIFVERAIGSTTLTYNAAIHTYTMKDSVSYNSNAMKFLRFTGTESSGFIRSTSKYEWHYGTTYGRHFAARFDFKDGYSNGINIADIPQLVASGAVISSMKLKVWLDTDQRTHSSGQLITYYGPCAGTNSSTAGTECTLSTSHSYEWSDSTDKTSDYNYYHEFDVLDDGIPAGYAYGFGGRGSSSAGAHTYGIVKKAELEIVISGVSSYTSSTYKNFTFVANNVTKYKTTNLDNYSVNRYFRTGTVASAGYVKHTGTIAIGNTGEASYVSRFDFSGTTATTDGVTIAWNDLVSNPRCVSSISASIDGSWYRSNQTFMPFGACGSTEGPQLSPARMGWIETATTLPVSKDISGIGVAAAYALGSRYRTSNSAWGYSSISNPTLSITVKVNMVTLGLIISDVNAGRVYYNNETPATYMTVNLWPSETINIGAVLGTDGIAYKYQFSEWVKSGSGTLGDGTTEAKKVMNTEFTVGGYNTRLTCKADRVTQQYAYNMILSEIEAGEISDSDVVDYGTDVAITFVPVSGWEFVRWDVENLTVEGTCCVDSMELASTTLHVRGACNVKAVVRRVYNNNSVLLKVGSSRLKFEAYDEVTTHSYGVPTFGTDTFEQGKTYVGFIQGKPDSVILDAIYGNGFTYEITDENLGIFTVTINGVFQSMYIHGTDITGTEDYVIGNFRYDSSTVRTNYGYVRGFVYYCDGERYIPAKLYYSDGTQYVLSTEEESS